MLSAFVISRDGAHLLPAVIANLRHVADEVIVVADMASIDDTFGVARQLADRAACWSLAGGVPEAVRTEAAALCSGDWLLMLDDDELLPPTLQARIVDLLRWPDAQEYVFSRKHIVGDGAHWLAGEPWFPDWQLRLRSRAAWQQYPWPRLPHSSPAPWQRQAIQAALWHLKFMVREESERNRRMLDWGRAWPQALDDHYRRFSLPERYDMPIAPLDEDAPAELTGLLARDGTGT
jgi:hypothetical protein